MVLFMNRFGKLLKYSWFGPIVLKSSTSSVEKLPSSSSFVSCDHLTIDEDIEMGWVQVENQSSSINIAHHSTDTSERSVSSSSFHFSIISVEETDWVMVDHPVTQPTSSPNPHIQPSSSSPTANPSETPNQDTSNLLPVSLSSSSSSNMDADHSAASSVPSTPNAVSSLLSISSSVSSSSSRSEHVDDSEAPLSRSSSSSSSSSSTHAPPSTVSSQSVSSTVSNLASTTPPRNMRHARISSHAILILYSSFKWHEILLAISFTVPVGLLSATFEKVKGVLVPAKLFTSNPTLFHIFIILDALAFTASVIGILLQALGKKKNKNSLSYLSLFAFTALVFAFTIYLSVLLPKLLVFIPYILLIIILLVLLYVGVSMYNGSCYNNHRVKSTSTLVANTATTV